MNWVRMYGPFGGVIQTSQGPSAVAPDGSFWIPPQDIGSFVARGCYFAGAGVASIKVGSYLISEDDAGGLQVIGPDGSILPLMTRGPQNV